MKLVKVILILPGTVLVLVPAILWFLTRPSIISPTLIQFKIALLFLTVGLFFAFWTVTLFKKIGKGTPGPWDPPKRMVIQGPYCYVRNPMISSVLFMLCGEMLLFNSLAIGMWFLIFFLGNLIYLPLKEEKSLRKRFGEDYVEYCKHVPRWIPRITPWHPTSQ